MDAREGRKSSWTGSQEKDLGVDGVYGQYFLLLFSFKLWLHVSPIGDQQRAPFIHRWFLSLLECADGSEASLHSVYKRAGLSLPPCTPHISSKQ